MEVFDLIGLKKVSLGKFCGSVLPGPFFSNEQTLSVVFKSDHGTSSIGFTASYTAVLPGAGECMHLLVREEEEAGKRFGIGTKLRFFCRSNNSLQDICGWSKD